MIEIDENDHITFNPINVTEKNKKKLILEFTKIWEISQSSIDILKNKEDSKVQGGLFGLHENFEMAVKTGFLISDRVVLIDYIYERILFNKDAKSINSIQLAQVAIDLVKLLPLAEKGRIVIIPNPFSWNNDSKRLINEVAQKVTLSMSLITMINMLSICKLCKLHPYTIASSKEEYTRIIEKEIDYTDLIGKDGGKYAYEGILGSLISQRLLSEIRFSSISDVPYNKFVEIISNYNNFHSEYLEAITQSGSLNADVNIDKIKKSVDLAQKNANGKLTTLLNTYSPSLNLSGSGLSLASVVMNLPPSLTSASSVAGLGLLVLGTLSEFFDNKQENTNTIISVFKDLEKVVKK
ncbi:conserved hypothetical protein [Arcobacter sp. L]|nr:conserved hypothetical protein [Arcobacter sp. L]